eukprot:1651349-Alexandrium_andersonii.AAC.1
MPLATAVAVSCWPLELPPKQVWPGGPPAGIDLALLGASRARVQPGCRTRASVPAHVCQKSAADG